MPKWQDQSNEREKDLDQQPIADTVLNQLILTQTPIRDHFKPIKSLGEGAYGKVYLAVTTTKEVEENVAIKIIKTENSHSLQDVYREVWYLEQSRGHPHLCQMRSAYLKRRPDNKVTSYIVMDVYSGTLRDVIEQGEFDILFDSALRQLTSALHYLHQLQIVHRDLSAGNIFVSLDQSGAQQHSLVIGDFGLARQFPECRSVVAGPTPKRKTNLLTVDKLCKTLTSRVTTREYRAPEIYLHSSAYTSAIDMWSLGVVLFYIATLTEPFDINRDRPSSTVFSEKIWPHYNNSISNPLSLKQPKSANQLAVTSSVGSPDFLRNNDSLTSDELNILSKLLLLAPSSRLTAAQLQQQYIL